MVGKTYLICVLISALTAIYLAVFHNLIANGHFMFASGILGMALAWLITGGMAYWAIINRNINQHKEWMIRSYVVTSSFTAFRIIFYGLMSLKSFPTKMTWVDLPHGRVGLYRY